MNILYTDKDPKKAAKNIPDNMLSPALKEAINILSTCIRIKSGKKGELKQVFSTPVGSIERVDSYPYVLENEDPENPEIELVYKPFDPCNIWARNSKGNFDWVVNFANAVSKEYKTRFEKDHPSYPIIAKCCELCKSLEFPYKGVTPVPMTGTVVTDDPLVHYKGVINSKKGAKWEKAKAPSWWVEKEQKK